MDDISFLVSETFKTVEKSSSQDHEFVPESVGILYTLAQNHSTYIIRAKASKNIKVDYDYILEQRGDNSLRLNEDNFTNVFWFETPFWEMSELIIDITTQKRFLKQGERLSNLSDPHLIWSIGHIGNKFIIDCSSRYAHKKDFQKLGYLGESSIALVRFSELMNKKYKDTIDIVSDQGLELTRKLEDFFTYHKYDKQWFCDYFHDQFTSNKAQAFELYFEELHHLMKFWKLINEQLSAPESPGLPDSL